MFDVVNHTVSNFPVGCNVENVEAGQSMNITFEEAYANVGRVQR